MKVLHVIPSVAERSGGPGQAIMPMCRALQDRGKEVMVATTDDGLNGSLSFGVPQSYEGVQAIFFPVQWGVSYKYSRPFAVWLNANVRNFDLVHIHAVFNHSSIASARACRKHSVPYIVRPLGTLDPWSMTQKSLKKTIFWQLEAKRMMRNAAAVHYTSRAEQEATEGSLALNHGCVIPLGVDLQVSPASVSERSLFNDLPARPYVLVLSRLHPKKGLDVLLEAFQALLKEKDFADWRLVLAGEGPDEYVATLKKKAQADDSGEAIVFPGWIENERKHVVLQNAALLALPSYHENFGLCVMEAMSYGVPVLVSPQVNLADEIQAAGAGWIAPVNLAAIKSTLAEALSNEEERRRRGLAGETLSRNFTWASVAASLDDIYLSIAPPTRLSRPAAS
jgi:glycosyltransferase involved in cell wall biosynthesis